MLLADGAVYRAVNSCLVPLRAVAGREVITVEGLARGGQLAEAQTAMMALGGSQCGYCTPGFVVSMVAAQSGGAERDPHALGGNLCRCTGYRPIADALRSLGGRAGPALPLDRPALLVEEFPRVRLRLADCFRRMRAVRLRQYGSGD